MLADLLVIEYASCVSGPYCTKLLADLGAEVIKIEDPVLGDEARRRGPFVEDKPDPEGSGLFLYVNSNKLGITLDVGKPAGAGVFSQLLRQADVLVENRPPGRMEELGFGFQDVKSMNPRLVMTSVTPFGQGGPDILAPAASAVMAWGFLKI